MKKKILVTGAAGFIGGNFILRLIQRGTHEIIGVDNLNDYYDVRLKDYRLKRIQSVVESFRGMWEFCLGDIADRVFLHKIFKKYRPDVVLNLAAQVGVRYSIENPELYIQSNIVGFFNVLEACRIFGVEHLIYASSGSVYGDNDKFPFSINDRTDKPANLYAATKKTDELLAYSYSKCYGIHTTGLRFFTVYGEVGRPDMFYFKLAENFRRDEPLELFNFGNCRRDFTYIADVTASVLRVLDKTPNLPFRVYNIGSNNPVSIIKFAEILQEELIFAKVLPVNFNFHAHIKLVPMQMADIPVTWADMQGFEKDFGFRPKTPLRNGLRNFAEWFKNFHLEGVVGNEIRNKASE